MAEGKAQVQDRYNHDTITEKRELFSEDTEQYTDKQQGQQAQCPQHQDTKKGQIIGIDIHDHTHCTGSDHDEGTEGHQCKHYFEHFAVTEETHTYQHQYKVQNTYCQQLEETFPCILCIGITLRQLQPAQKQTKDLDPGEQQIYRGQHTGYCDRQHRFTVSMIGYRLTQ